MGSTASIRINPLYFLFKLVYCILYARKKASTVAVSALLLLCPVDSWYYTEGNSGISIKALLKLCKHHIKKNEVL